MPSFDVVLNETALIGSGSRLGIRVRVQDRPVRHLSNRADGKTKDLMRRPQRAFVFESKFSKEQLLLKLFKFWAGFNKEPADALAHFQNDLANVWDYSGLL